MTTENTQVIAGALDWDAEIGDGEQKPAFVLLAPGEYIFRVIDLEKGYFNGSAKLQPCPKATVTLEFDTLQGKATIKEGLLLHSSMEWKLASFFRSIGLKKHDEKLKMQWDKVVGQTGRAKVKQEEWTDQKGTQHTTNRIEAFLDFSEEEMPIGQETPFDEQDLPF